MDWAALRAHYAHLFAEAQRKGETQQSVAARGGLRQNAISKLLDNDGLGPQIETFTKAVEGLGISLSAFFLQLEGKIATAREDSAKKPLPTAQLLGHDVAHPNLGVGGGGGGAQDPAMAQRPDDDRLNTFRTALLDQIGNAFMAAAGALLTAQADDARHRTGSADHKGARKIPGHRQAVGKHSKSARGKMKRAG